MNAQRTIEERLAGVEGSLRRWRLAFFVVVVGVVGMGAAAAVNDATFGTVKATEFLVVNENGKTVGRLGVEKAEGESGLGALIVETEDKLEAVRVIPGLHPAVRRPK